VMICADEARSEISEALGTCRVNRPSMWSDRLYLPLQVPDRDTRAAARNSRTARRPLGTTPIAAPPLLVWWRCQLGEEASCRSEWAHPPAGTPACSWST
jgi:hypothetical protein